MLPCHQLPLLFLTALVAHRAAAFSWDWPERDEREKYYDQPEYYEEDYYSDFEEEFKPSERLLFDPRYEHPEKREKHRHRHYHDKASLTPAPLIFLAPLAGLAALYAMAYINTNPALLTLVTVSGRKKRSASIGEVEEVDYLNEVGVLSRFMSANPGLDLADQRDFLMSSVLQCSSLGSSQCLDSLVCEFSREHSSYTEVEKDTITMVLYHLLASSHLEEDIKSRIRVAAGLGRKDHCHIFSCSLVS